MVMFERAGPASTRTTWWAFEVTHWTSNVNDCCPPLGARQRYRFAQVARIPSRQVVRRLFMVAALMPASGFSWIRTTVCVPAWR